MRLFGARRKRLSAPDFSRILISSRNHCKSSKKFARPGTDDARRKLKPLMNTDEHGAAQPQPKNERCELIGGRFGVQPSGCTGPSRLKPDLRTSPQSRRS